jgi:hypothetical protein
MIRWTIKALRLKLILLSIILFLAPNIRTAAQDLLDNVKSNSQLIFDLKDLYRALYISNIITEQKELINLSLNGDWSDDIHGMLQGFIKGCESLKRYKFHDQTLEKYNNEYLASTIQSYRIANSKGFKSAEFKNDYQNYKAAKDKYMEYIFTTYATEHFIHFTEEQYYKNNDKGNFVNATKYLNLKTKDTSLLRQRMNTLDSISKHAKDFQQYAIYQIELADLYVKHADTLGYNAKKIAIEKYKAIFDQNKYCIYLFEAWLKWRIVLQDTEYGLSKSSEIPNEMYDSAREQIALVILNQVTRNEKDEMAINEFLLMATHEIVRRYGAYKFGNQNTVEYHETFDDKQ